MINVSYAGTRHYANLWRLTAMRELHLMLQLVGVSTHYIIGTPV